jgi:hypothetical protein
MTRLSKLPIKMSPGLGLSMLDRAIKESFAARCATADLAQLRAYFETEGAIRCFYCDAIEPTRWDHLHAVSRGGDTVPGNLVPACGRCDDSKQDRDVEEWINSKSKHRPASERLRILQSRIEAYQRHFAYNPVEFEKRLSAEQLSRYRRFREQVETLRRHLEGEGLLKTR